ncbi:sensor histidine kinase [Desertihabitans aurantiacus]|uniref:sensor histidine kinase n=1 Tax=Desertihabitans aurantiacus TaxID=2282477 RepID=UPI000DF82B85|nr:histidine kinase [Desertihabitans aurantiacus]
MPERTAQWLQRDGLWARVVVTACMLLYTLPISVGFVWRGWDTVQLLVISLGLTLPWLVGHRRPLLCFAVMAGAGAVQIAYGHPLMPANLLLPASIFTLADRRPKNVSLPALGVVLVEGVVAAVHWEESLASAIAPIAALCLISVCAWTWGHASSLRRAYAESLEQAAEHLRRERAHLAEIAAARERTRIARDMHDVISHSIAGVLTLAEGTLRADPDLPERQREALQSISRSCRQCLREFRALLRVLRDDGDLPETPAISDLRSLLEVLEASGVVTHVHADAGERQTPPAHQEVVYRLVQEAVTNTQRHATDVHRFEVRIAVIDQQLEVLVSDDGLPAAEEAETGSGLGLRGMRERVEALGGTLEHGPQPPRGYRLRAQLPLGTTTGPAPDVPQPELAR